MALAVRVAGPVPIKKQASKQGVVLCELLKGAVLSKSSAVLQLNGEPNDFTEDTVRVPYRSTVGRAQSVLERSHNVWAQSVREVTQCVGGSVSVLGPNFHF